MRLLPLAGADGGAIRAQLCNIRVALAQRPQDRNEEQSLAENPCRRKPQRVPQAAMVILVRQHRTELRLSEQLDGSLGNVDSGAQVAGTKRLGARIGDHFDARIAVEGLCGTDLSNKRSVATRLPPACTDGYCDRCRPKRPDGE